MAFTFFFRDEQILSTTVKQLVPMVIGRKNVHILNAGCAMGMETYTLAILLAETMGKFALRNIKIHAVDIDEENVNFGKTVREGIYHRDFLQRIPVELFSRYFQPTEKENYFAVHPDLRSLVTFQKYDLLSLKPLRTDYSLVICKNVLLHFSYEQRIEVLDMFWSLLLKDGLLAMENTQQMPDELKNKYRKLIDYGQLHQKISSN